MPNLSPTVLVTGATGNIGVELIHLLSRDPGVGEVRAATRAPDSDGAELLRAIAPARVKPIAFDAAYADGLASAFEGVDVLCLITPLGPEAVEWQEAVLNAAGGVRRIIKVSVDAASPDAKEGPGALHWAGEELVRAMGKEYAILRPTIFMQHFLIVPGVHVAGEDVFYLPVGGGAMAMLDCRDIARAMAVLATAEARGLPADAVPLTGPEALTGDELAAQLSAAAGRTIRWEVTPEAFEEHSKETGSPLELLGIYQAGADGAFAETRTEGFEALTGSRPASFAKFASDYADAFRSRT